MNNENISQKVLENLYLRDKLNIKQIAKKLGMSSYRIRNEMIRNNIEIRNPPNTIKYIKTHFSNNLKEKAYMLGLRCGDVHARRAYNFIRITTTTTHLAFIKMMEDTFEKYSHVCTHFRFNKDHNEWIVYCDLDDSFEFLINKPNRIPEKILNHDELFYHFLAGYMDSEGSWVITKSNENDIRFIFSY